ncbi:hypothetical protein [Streptomyces sp. SYSU K217416]
MTAVPKDVRDTFREQVIGLVLDCDTQRGTELIPTLAAFLASDCAWTDCANRLSDFFLALRPD